MEEARNNIPEQVKIHKIGVEDNIDMGEHDNIIELLKTPWSFKNYFGNIDNIKIKINRG